MQNFKRHKTAAGHHIDELEHLANRAEGAPQHDNAGIDLDTVAQTVFDQAPATDHQSIDDMELGVGHPPEEVLIMADETAEG